MPKARQAEGRRLATNLPRPGRAAETARSKDSWLHLSWSIHRDGLSVLAPFEDHLEMLLKGVQARLQSMKHRDGAFGLLSGLNQLVNDLFCPRDTIAQQSRCVARLGQGSPACKCRAEDALALAGQRRAHRRELILLRRVDLRVSEIEARHCLHGRRGDEKPTEPLVVGRYDEPWRFL